MRLKPATVLEAHGILARASSLSYEALKLGFGLM